MTAIKTLSGNITCAETPHYRNEQLCFLWRRIHKREFVSSRHLTKFVYATYKENLVKISEGKFTSS